MTLKALIPNLVGWGDIEKYTTVNIFLALKIMVELKTTRSVVDLIYLATWIPITRDLVELLQTLLVFKIRTKI